MVRSHQEAKELQRHGLSAGETKTVAVELAARWSGRTKREIGAHYGNISGQAVSMIRQRIKENRAINWARLENFISRK